MEKQNKAKKLRWLPLITFVFVGIFLIWQSNNPHYIEDFIRSRKFEPSTDIININKNLDLTNAGKMIFYASYPQVNSATDFNKNCTRPEQNTSILGCYYMKNIYLFNITHADLKYAKDVTAAHELLHAIYERLSVTDKQMVNNLLQEELKKLDNAEYKWRIDYYNRTEPGELNNELHSIIGTEIKEINPELEKYYAKYFNNRKKIVDLYNSYNQQFKDLRAEAEKLDKEIKNLEKELNSSKSQYDAQINKLNSDIDNFNYRNNQGYYESESAFYADRNRLINRSNYLEGLRSQINKNVEKYNDLVNLYNKNSARTNDLYSGMDSLSGSKKISQ